MTSRRPRKVVIIGAGPSGLAAAFRLGELARERGVVLEVTVLEASERAGGAIGTDDVEGFLVERGADGFLTEKTAVVDIARRLGIEGRLVRTKPSDRGASVVFQGRLEPIPEGFSMMAPTLAMPILRSPVLSARGKARMALEMLLPRGTPRDDESLASFVRRRFGDEVLDRLAQPLIGGIYGADPDRLGLRATMPRFLDAETRWRSVIRGVRHRAREASATSVAGAPAKAATGGARYGLFASFDRGVQVLVDALVDALPASVLALESPVSAIVPRDEGVRVLTPRGTHEADTVIFASNASRLSSLLGDLDGDLATRLAEIPNGSAATVTLAFERRAFSRPLEGYGFVVPRAEARSSIAATFLSRKWADRAPDDFELVRVFLGGPTSPSVHAASDGEMIEAALHELRALVGLTGEPRFCIVRRWTGAMPQYEVGHLTKVAAIEAALARHRWLRLAGNSLHGVGLPDAIRAGERAAESLFA